MHAIEGELDRPAVQALLTEHLEDMRAATPPESVHALDFDGLRGLRITSWTLWDNDRASRRRFSHTS